MIEESVRVEGVREILIQQGDTHILALNLQLIVSTEVKVNLTEKKVTEWQ